MYSKKRINHFDIYNSIELLDYETLEELLSGRHKNETGEAYWFMVESIYESASHLYKECIKVAKVLLKFYQRPETFKSKLLQEYDKNKERKKEEFRVKTLNTLALCLNRNNDGKQINKDIFSFIKEFL
jgi:hypothetical protein